MKTILHYFWYQEKYNLHRTVNGFFYYLRKLPLVGQSIPESIFKSYSFKSALFLFLISLTALFSFHDLFIYYILQPFTKDMEVINPVYKFLSGALYWVAYLNIKLDLGSHLYILLISLAMIAYVSIGYWILLKKAPQTFRLKL
ncbi:TPA: hypothetical protein ACGPDF_000810 [Streptococcus suis]|nr:hypothetical protein [Streptococcus parasuis]HEM3655693.1 hypothetical protein [Streptococcus suis]WDN58378.1 hypothetical protein LOD77_09045 [Streptococcus parasuis]WDN60194.1 hypothetical protein LOD78_08965 [Streptococcus parasuis]HEM3665496.1 hypothetical protein [Streptococcus suis]HEM3673846.1 hypothetical protein [Streptococcus suis]